MKTFEQLGINSREYTALIRVRDYLRGAGKDQLVRSGELFGSEPFEEKPGHHFNMNYTTKVYKCGSVGCIGGHVSLEMQGCELGPNMSLKPRQADRADSYVDGHRHSALRHLYFPHMLQDSSWDLITPTIAAQAIDNFLNTADPGWEALAEEHGLQLVENDDPDL